MAEREDTQPGTQQEPLLECIVVGELEANCYIVACPETREAIIVDPGAEAAAILARVDALGVRVVAVAHTHGHFDHISATEAVLASLPERVPLIGHRADAYFYEQVGRALGVQFGYALPETLVAPDTFVDDEDELDLGTLRLRVLHTPGHTPGSVSLVCGDAFVLSGDTLFRHGIGRFDLPGGDEERIYESILAQLYPLPAGLLVYPGHGPATTIGEERAHNPFVRA